MESKSFRGKFNWIGLVTLFGPSGIFLVPGSPFAIAGSGGLSLALKLFWIAFAALGGWIVLDTWYTVKDGRLLARAAFFRPPMPNLQDIDAVGQFKHPFGPALRIRFRRNGKNTFLAIFPADRAGFMEALQANAPGLRSDSGGLIRQ